MSTPRASIGAFQLSPAHVDMPTMHINGPGPLLNHWDSLWTQPDFASYVCLCTNDAEINKSGFEKMLLKLQVSICTVVPATSLQDGTLLKVDERKMASCSKTVLLTCFSVYWFKMPSRKGCFTNVHRHQHKASTHSSCLTFPQLGSISFLLHIRRWTPSVILGCACNLPGLSCLC